jgi:hypothetical protein
MPRDARTPDTTSTPAERAHGAFEARALGARVAGEATRGEGSDVVSSVPHECPRGRRCFDCHPRVGIEHTGELPAWMQRRVGEERPTPVPYASQPVTARIDAVRAELRRLVDEAIRTAPESALRVGRVGAARASGTAADEQLERLAYVLTRLHETSESVDVEAPTERGPLP